MSGRRYADYCLTTIRTETLKVRNSLRCNGLRTFAQRCVEMGQTPETRTKSRFCTERPDNSDSGGRGFESRRPYQRQASPSGGACFWYFRGGVVNPRPPGAQHVQSAGGVTRAARDRSWVRIPSAVPNVQNPNRFFPVEDGLGFCVFFGYGYYRNGVKRKLEPR